ncbi:MAG: hypothetical protein A2287_06655 [Candidatus Melainabacteria bacterium RIFOXYA12_FULL_32_12]|nr:MAG: hypothetical protein A2255_09720 [Candidatus Melainabacteria bacterium RIFOXYA2_FULL_32_9]OGI26889.1 MAG: hypothetical protein A2287_06655 [Candidatus Melainabacteria bacterium RIFOXYA12_FULL_32_12]
MWKIITKYIKAGKISDFKESSKSIKHILKGALVDFSSSRFFRCFSYLSWLIKDRKRQHKIVEASEHKFAIIYFYQDKFSKLKFAQFERSLKKQIYKNYSVFIALDNLSNILDEIYQKKCTHICFVEQGDLISNHALSSIVCAISKYPDTELIYSDEDIRNFLGFRYNAYFKPQYAPFLLWSHNYINALLTVKVQSSIFSKLKNIDKLSQAELYKFILEITRDKLNIHRISDILYHRSYGNYRKLKNTSTQKIVEAELIQRNLNAEILKNSPKSYNILKFKPENNPKVSIIIPFRDKIDVLKNCVDSIEQKSTYKNYEIILVNNRSQNQDTLDYLEIIKHKVIDADMDFNFSKLNNMAVNVAEGEYIVLLNNDIEVISPDWIESSLGLAQLDHVGVVGAKLLYPNNRIQHVGMVKRRNGDLCHVNIKVHSRKAGYKNYNRLIREFMCLTGACIMVSKAKYLEVGGLNENLAVECNDTDFCFKLLEAGYYNLYNPHCILYHFESLSRRGVCESSISQEKSYQIETWKKYLEDDIFYNTNFAGRYFC